MARQTVGTFFRVGLRSMAAGALTVGLLGAIAAPAHAASPRIAAHDATCYPYVPITTVGNLPTGEASGNGGTVGVGTITFDLLGAHWTITEKPNATGDVETSGSVTTSCLDANTPYYATNASTNITYKALISPPTGGSPVLDTLTCSVARGADGINLEAGLDPTTDNPVEILTGTLNCEGTYVYFRRVIDSSSFGIQGGATATPELGSGELLATGLVPVLGIWFMRRRRPRVSRQ